MKIKILKEIPVKRELRPVVGGVYDVIEEQASGSHNVGVYFIIVKGEKVGVLSSPLAEECLVVER